MANQAAASAAINVAHTSGEMGGGGGRGGGGGGEVKGGDKNNHRGAGSGIRLAEASLKGGQLSWRTQKTLPETMLAK